MARRSAPRSAARPSQPTGVAAGSNARPASGSFQPRAGPWLSYWKLPVRTLFMVLAVRRRRQGLTPEWMAKYPPELNAIERDSQTPRYETPAENVKLFNGLMSDFYDRPAMDICRFSRQSFGTQTNGFKIVDFHMILELNARFDAKNCRAFHAGKKRNARVFPIGYDDVSSTTFPSYPTLMHRVLKELGFREHFVGGSRARPAGTG